LLTKGAIEDSFDSKDATKHKIRAFRRANIKVLDHIGYIGEEMKELLKAFKEKK
jgi:succinyl-CoA synthetase alpha subunit